MDLNIPIPAGGTIEPNGDLTFLAKGQPHKAIQGFKKISDWHWTPILKPCTYRQKKYIYYERCKCSGQVVHCALFDTINLSKCVGCKEAKE